MTRRFVDAMGHTWVGYGPEEDDMPATAVGDDPGHLLPDEHWAAVQADAAVQAADEPPSDRDPLEEG